MFKVFSICFKAILFVIAVFVCAKIGLYKQALHKQRQEFISTKNYNKLSPEVLHRLNQLTAIPLIGSFYLEPKVEQLIKLERFEEGLQIVTELVESSHNQRSFSLWYFKAKAELGLNLFKECEQTLTKASTYSEGRWDDLRLSLIMDKINNHKAFEKLRSLDSGVTYGSKEKGKDYERELINRQNQIL